MKHILLMVAVSLSACTLRDGPVGNRDGFQSSSAAALVGVSSGAAGPAVYTPAQDITAPSAGISRRCIPQADATAAACSPL